ncbi:IclR family transcriptional regulator domain-containing protein [Streptomyces lavendofoliae]|uniref:IclR family transcriptional regulator domain-containing protein n=1 Tax=Streptomyces lavendofoliae TaxID=67314 RepID=UPI001E348114|nr:IclR family transcriptional regulator C-terminal domain-containing protein [Streptomyces lavendofoliae]
MSRYDGPRDECSKPPVPAGLTALLRELEGAGDFWDRPYGACGPVSDDTAEEERAMANSLYRLGTKALRRGELATAGDLLGRAGEQGHPGALFRLAVVVHRRFGDEGRDDAEFLVAEAARCGHGDARELLGPGVAAGGAGRVGAAQDPEFADEVRAALGRPPAASPGGGRPGRPRDGRADTQPVAPVPGRADTQPGPAVPAPGRPVAAPVAGHGADRPSGPATRGGGLAPAPAPAGGLWVPGGHAGRSRLWTPSPMRSPSLTDLAQRVPSAHESAQRWQHAMRVLDVLHAIGGADGPVSAAELARGTGLEAPVLERLLAWLAEQHLVAVPEPGVYSPGPLLRVWAGHRGTEREEALRTVLSELRDRVGAAVYVSRYTDGEVRITQYAAGPGAPAVREWVPFREAAHASAVGKSLLAQLDFEERMDHLDRRRPVPLTSRTITDHRHLFQALDHHGPLAAQFDLLEYSEDEVCVAFPLTVAGRAGCVALSLPLAHQHRLLEAADALSNRSAALLATLLLAEEPSAAGQGAPPGDDGAAAFARTGVPGGSEQPVPLGRHAGGAGGARGRHGR